MPEKENGLPADWSQLSPEQKREYRYSRWAESENEIKFTSPEARKRYSQKLKRLRDVYCVREPDRVPVSINSGVLPFYSDGMDYNAAIHDPAKAAQACIKFNAQYGAQLDNFAVPISLIPVGVFENLNYKLYSWPGYGLPSNGTVVQFVEGEYMRPDEYDAFIRNPSDFWMRTYLPRAFGAFEPFKRLNPVTDIIEFPTVPFMPLITPDVQKVLRQLIEAGDRLRQWSDIIQDLTRQGQESGYNAAAPNVMSKAPFDILGDTLRGTQGIMKDMYRQPQKLLKALEVTADLAIDSVLNSPAMARGMRVFFPLHKGADGWMSQKQFDTFYWPFLKKVMDAFINEGFKIALFAEGSYNSRLESVGDFPHGSVHWWFDQTDIVKAKKILGSEFSIEGNVPSSLLVTGSPRDVKEYSRKLIDACAPGGGYILGGGASIENPKLENLLAMIEAAREFGVYSRP
jgi:uroporphyrinogen-III decarboxylase